MKHSILIVEDEPRFAAQLSAAARDRGFLVHQTANGLDAVQLVSRDLPDIILLDWSIDGISGIEVCRQLRSLRGTRPIPIIMMSGKGDEDDRVHGLTSGADDYLVKPLSETELFARIGALLRRLRPLPQCANLNVGDIRLNTETMRATRNDLAIDLRSRELQLLHFLMQRPGEVVSAERLRRHVWGSDRPVTLWSVAQSVHRLRRGLGCGGGADPLRTVRGEGYSLEI